MKIKDKRLFLCLLALSAITIAAVVLRTVACFTDLDVASGHFRSGALFIVSASLVAFGVLSALAYVFLPMQRVALLSDCHGALTNVGAGLLGGAFAFFAIDTFARAFSSNAVGITKLALIFTALSAIVSVAFVFLYPMLGPRLSEIRGFAGLFAISCLALYSIYLLSDSSLPLNVPGRIVDQMAYISAALFFIGEVRLFLGREIWKLYTVLGMIAMLLTAYSAIPAIIYYFGNAYSVENYTHLSKSIAETALTLALFFFITVRTFKIAFLNSDEPGPIAKTVSDIIDSKQAESVESPDKQSDNENQISIDDIISAENSATQNEVQE